ncbi:MAG: GIY-YIG nuclease family protein [Desulfomonilaceae bacterium]
MTPIKLTDLIKIDDPTQYKLHLACTSDGTKPLDEYVEGRDKWVGWNRWRGAKDDWNRKFIFSFIEFYHIPDAWLFGDIFRVIARHDPGTKGSNPTGYDLERVEGFDKYEGRLICKFHRYQGLRGRAYRLENFIDSFEVLEILPNKYEGETFTKYEEVNRPFGFLKAIIHREKQDWKAPLSAVKGVYLIMDTSSGKYYVGSAYGDGGVWSRLSCYINIGHGWDQGLLDLINTKEAQGEKDYAIKNFKFSLLETFPFTTPDQTIINRETYWKEVLMSKNNFGHFNRN